MYKKKIEKLIRESVLDVDTDVEVRGRPPTLASSEFLTNKEQGDWAEDIVLRAINEFSEKYIAIKYGRSENISAGDLGFEEFFNKYQSELNSIGKKPDLLIFRKSDVSDNLDIEKKEVVEKAVAAIEVRSSSFLVNKYNYCADERRKNAIQNCMKLRKTILSEPYKNILQKRNLSLFNFIENASENSFQDLTFRKPVWRTNKDAEHLCDLLKELKKNIKVLHKRDYLSITPKVEDIALVNRWIQNFNVKHFYLQVFFDKAYIISFKEILELIKDDSREEKYFEIGKDVKNQNKTTVKVNVMVGREVIGKIDAPSHKSLKKELDRGRLLFYVSFSNGKGYLDKELFEKEIVDDE